MGQTFASLLPERQVGRCERLAGLHSLAWYGALGGFDADAFGSAISEFTTSTAGSIAAAAP